MRLYEQKRQCDSNCSYHNPSGVSDMVIIQEVQLMGDRGNIVIQEEGREVHILSGTMGYIKGA